MASKDNFTSLNHNAQITWIGMLETGMDGPLNVGGFLTKIQLTLVLVYAKHSHNT